MASWEEFAFGKSAKVKEVRQRPWQQEGIDFLSSLLRQRPPVAGVAGMSPAEQQGQGILQGILSGSAFQDPSTSLAYRGLRNQMAEEEERGAQTMRQRAQLGGMLNSSGAIGAEGRYRADMSNRRMSLLGGLYDQERQRDNPYTRLQASLTAGSLPRLLQQAQLDAQQQAAMAPWTLQGPIAQSLIGHEGTYYTKPAEPSRLGQYMDLAGSLAQLAGIFGGI